MPRSVRLLFMLLLGLSLGCGSARNAPQHAWLRKQGRPPARSIAPASVEPAPPANSPPRAGLAHASTSASAAAGHALPPSADRTMNQAAFTATPSARAATAVAAPPPDQEPVAVAAPEGSWNAKAIAALPLGLATLAVGIAAQSIALLLIGGAISFALGLIGSRQSRDRAQRGKGLAIAGMVLGGAALFFSVMVLIWAAR